MLLPLRGEYFVFQLDPVASIAEFEDPIATKACLDMKNKHYLACVVEWQGGIPVVGFPYASDIMLVSTRGMVPGPEDGILPEMSCPILPSSTPHPLDREPVDCTPPLPWPDCFHLTMAWTTVRVQHKTQDARDRGKYQLVPQNEAVYLMELHEHDDEWRQEIDAAYRELHDAEQGARSLHSSYTVASTSSASSTSSLSSLQIPTSSDNWLHETPIVKFSFDLENFSAEDISVPWEYQQEHEAYLKVADDAKRRVRQKIQATRRLDDELFPVPCLASHPRPICQPEPTEGSSPPSPLFYGDGQVEAGDSSSPVPAMVLDDSDSINTTATPTVDDAGANTPLFLNPRDRLKAALALEPHKVANAPLTKMPDREKFIDWEREISAKMDRMFTDIIARGRKKEEAADDNAIVKRTPLQMLCLPDARPQHMEALVEAFQRQREDSSLKPESTAKDDSTDTEKKAKGVWLTGLIGPLKTLGTFLGCHSSAVAGMEGHVLNSPVVKHREPAGSLFKRLRQKVFGKL